MGILGNWGSVKNGSGTSAYNTDSVGGFDDKQVKVTGAADSTYLLRSIGQGQFTGIEANSYYLYSFRAYLDPNADVDRITYYFDNFDDSTIIANYDNGTSTPMRATIPKGVWTDVWGIVALGSDLTGFLRFGLWEGTLTANDIAYFDDFSLRKITFSDDWTAGTGWGPKFALTAPSLGDEELSNGDFSGTWGVDDLPQGYTQIGTVDAGSYLVKDDANDRLRIVSDGDMMGVSQAVLTVGTLYRIEIDVETVTSGSLRIQSNDAEAYDVPLAGVNTPLAISSAGLHSIVFRAGSTSAIIRRSAACDVTINSWSIKPYTPSHSNTDPRFYRQTESNEYTSDFSTDADGWLQVVQLAGNTNGIGGQDDTLQFTVGAAESTHKCYKNLTLTANSRYKVSFDYYIPAGQSNIDGIRPYDRASGEWLADIQSTTDAWTTVENIYFTATGSGDGLQINAYDGSDASFLDPGGDDVFYIKNVTIDAVTLTAPDAATVWKPYDENGGAITVAAGGLYYTEAVENTYYLFLFKVSGVTAGAITPYAAGTNGASQGSSGVKSMILKAGSTVPNIGLYANSDWDGVLEYCYIIPITTPVAHCTGSQSAASNLYSAAGIISDYTNYKGAVTVANRSAGALTKLYFGSAEGIVDVSADADDTYTRYGNSGDSDDRIYLKADADFVGDITALSVKEVTRHAKGTMLLALTPAYAETDVSGSPQAIVGVTSGNTSLLYHGSAGAPWYSYDGSNSASKALSWEANTTYLIAVQWGDTISNVNNMRIGAVAIASPWTSGAWGSDAEFDGAYTLGTDLNLFYSKFGSNNLRDLMFFDRILTDDEIESIRKRLD
jgi:hypothetical protein